MSNFIHCGHCKRDVPTANMLNVGGDHALAIVEDVTRDPVTRKRTVQKRQVLVCLVGQPMRVATPTHSRSDPWWGYA